MTFAARIGREGTCILVSRSYFHGASSASRPVCASAVSSIVPHARGGAVQESSGWPTDGSTVSVNSREGCVTKCGTTLLNSSGRLPFARSPAKTVLTFVYTYHSSTRYILSKETHRFSQRNGTFNTQFPN